ncbi:MAG TPA: hypothetical protein P5229_04060, partial [Candidatus Gracilibacteria bacterium]|nr:hypothetical protein [Candidatus Gracilibacteria bacterium]
MAARSEGDGLERILISEQIKDQKLDLLARSLRTSAERIAKETGMPVIHLAFQSSTNSGLHLQLPCGTTVSDWYVPSLIQVFRISTPAESLQSKG